MLVLAVCWCRVGRVQQPAAMGTETSCANSEGGGHTALPVRGGRSSQHAPGPPQLPPATARQPRAQSKQQQQAGHEPGSHRAARRRRPGSGAGPISRSLESVRLRCTCGPFKATSTPPAPQRPPTTAIPPPSSPIEAADRPPTHATSGHAPPTAGRRSWRQPALQRARGAACDAPADQSKQRARPRHVNGHLPLNHSSATKRTGHQPRRDAHRRRPDSGAGGCLHGSLRAAWRATPPTPAGSSQQPLGSDTTHQTSLHQRARADACADEGARVRPDGSARGNPHEDCAGDAACDAPNGHWQQPTAPGT